MTVTVGQAIAIGVGFGLIIGAAVMALWAARRIGEEAAKQFDHGFERGRWLTDVAAVRNNDRGRGERLAKLLGFGGEAPTQPDPQDPGNSELIVVRSSAKPG